MHRNHLFLGLIIFACAAVVCPLLADTDTVDVEIAATKGNPAAVKKLQLRSMETLEGNAPAMEKDRACRVLRVIGTVDSVEVLEALLADKELSHMARYALEPMPYAEAGKALRDALGKTSGAVKVGIIHSLAVREDKQAVSVLAGLLQGSDVQVGAAAAWALGRIATPQAVRVLTASHATARKQMRGAVADGLLNAAGQLAGRGSLQEAVAIYRQLQTADSPKHVRMGSFAGLVRTQPDKAAGMLINAIGSDDRMIKGMAIDMIVGLKGDGVTARFSKELGKHDADTQVLLIGALVDRGEKGALRPVLTAAASSANPAVRAIAVKSLGDVGDGSSVKVLVNAIAKGRSDEEKQLAASSLRRLSADGVNGAIIRSMKTAAAADRAKLIEILRDRRATEAVDELLAAAGDKDEDVRKAAFKALAELARPKDQKTLINLLVGLKGDKGRTEAERAIAAVSRRIEDEASRADAVLAVKGTTMETKCSLIRVLGGIGNARAFETVRTALDDRDSRVRDTAVRTLADWPDSRAIGALLEVFRTTSDRTHRIVALRGCVRLLSTGTGSSQDTLKACGELMKGTRGPEEKKLVLACLAKVGDPAAITMVEPLLADDKVKAEAELAILGIVRNMVGSMPNEAKAAAQKLKATSKDKSVRQAAAKIIRQIK